MHMLILFSVYYTQKNRNNKGADRKKIKKSDFLWFVYYN